MKLNGSDTSSTETLCAKEGTQTYIRNREERKYTITCELRTNGSCRTWLNALSEGERSNTTTTESPCLRLNTADAR